MSELESSEVCEGVREILQKPIVETTPEAQLDACQHVLKCPLCFLWSQRQWASKNLEKEAS